MYEKSDIECIVKTDKQYVDGAVSYICFFNYALLRVITFQIRDLDKTKNS